MGGQPPGPVGTATNNPRIDEGTLTRACQNPPCTTGGPQTQAEAKPKYFDIRRLFPTMTVLGWKTGRSFMAFWAAGNACVANNRRNSETATIGVNVDNQCMRIYQLDWQWLLSFDLAAENLRQFKQRRIINDKVKAQIAQQYGKLHAPGKLNVGFNAWLKDGLLPAAFRQHIKDHQLQYWEVRPGVSDPAQFDDLIAALNNYAYYAMYQGEVYTGVEYRKLEKAPTISLPGIAPHLVKDAFEKLGSGRYKAIVYVSNVGVYAGDIYEFNGNQYLATWDIVNHRVESSYADAAKPWEDWDDPEDVKITIRTYQDYRSHTGKGGDFMALTPIQLTGPKLLVPVE